jgi:hypothetical protein
VGCGPPRRREYCRGFFPYSFACLVNYSLPHRSVAAPYTLAACQRSLLYLYALSAPGFSRRPLRPRKLPYTTQDFQPCPPEVARRPLPALSGHQHVGHHPEQRTPPSARPAPPLRRRHPGASPLACRLRSSRPLP